jgi:hypothetical protein
MQRRAFLFLLFLCSVTSMQLKAADKLEPSPQPLENVERRLDSIDQKLNNSDVQNRLAGIEKTVNDLKHSSIITTSYPLSSLRLQRWRAFGLAAKAKGIYSKRDLIERKESLTKRRRRNEI